MALSVDEKHVVLYTPEGETLTLLQGDPRIPRIIEQSQEKLNAKQPAEVDLSPVINTNPEYADCEQKTGIKFFRLAKKFLKDLLNTESPTSVPKEVAHVRPMDIGVFPKPVLETEPENATPEYFSDIVLVQCGDNKVAAIKAVREALGCGLKEAKDWVEAAPHRFERVPADDAGKLFRSLRDEGCVVHVVGVGETVPVEPSKPKQELTNEEKLANANAKLDILTGNGVTPDKPEFHTPLDEKQETIVAVKDGKVIPDAQKLQRQLKQASKLNDFTGFQNFFNRLTAIIDRRGHSVEDLMKFMEHGDLPIADDGCIVIYKRLKTSGTKDVFVDCHTGKVKQKVGSFVFMREGLVDPNRRQDCSNGLHVGSLSYMGNFSGNVTVIAKVRPEDVIAVPQYSHTKMRVCGYHILAQLTGSQHDIINRGKSICDAPGGTELLNKVLRGDHIGITQHVEIGAQHGGNLKITDVAEQKTTDVTVKEMQNTTLNMEEGIHDAKPPVAETVKATDLKPQEAKPVAETKAQKAQRLYQDYKSTGNAAIAAELVALKKASKASWEKLGLSNEIGKLLIEANDAGEAAKPVEGKKVEDFAPLNPNKQSNSPREQIRDLLDAGVSTFEQAEAIVAIKKRSKKGWSALGVDEQTVKLLADLIANK